MTVPYRSGKHDELFEKVVNVIREDGWLSTDEFVEMTSWNRTKARELLREWAERGRLVRQEGESSIFVLGKGVDLRYSTKEA